MDMVLDLFVLITTMTVFLMNMDFRYKLKKIILLFVGFGILSFSAYMIFLQLGYDKETMSFVCFSLPSLILCFRVSKYRGARFIFTFALTDLIGIVIVIIGRFIGYPFVYSQTIISVSTTVMLALYVYGAYRFRNNYLEILRSVNSGWKSMALASVVMYILTFMMIGYPEPIRNRSEYFPTLIIYLVLVFVIFKVIYEAARNNIQVYIETLENENLNMKIELNQVYYDLAYRDDLSGLKNRNAYEEYLENLEKDAEKKILCISFDVDNLKEVNDEVGHHAGDLIIRNVGKMLRESFAPVESIFRIGGDEFIVIVENKDEMWANEKCELMDLKAESIREELGIAFEYSRGKCDGNNSEVRRILRIADKEMYKEKRKHKEISRHYS